MAERDERAVAVGPPSKQMKNQFPTVKKTEKTNNLEQSFRLYKKKVDFKKKVPQKKGSTKPKLRKHPLTHALGARRQRRKPVNFKSTAPKGIIYNKNQRPRGGH